MNTALDIAVAGAGIGGLAAAALLARAGHRVHILDQFESPQAVGSGLMLQKTGLAVLSELGLRDHIEARGSKIDRLSGLTSKTRRPVLDVRFEDLSKSLYGLGVQRRVLFDALLGAALEAGAELEPQKQIRSVDRASGTITMTDGRQTQAFDLIIDALGVNSVLTRQQKKELPYGALWATFQWPLQSHFKKNALEQRYDGASKMAGIMASGRLDPDEPETLTYFWSIRSDQEAVWRTRPLQEWRDVATALWPETGFLLKQIETHNEITFARYRHRTHPTPVSGPFLAHIGDAWHAASPQLGQGANMALLDAWALAEAFTQMDTKSGALQRYKELRATHVRMYQWATYLFTPFYQSDSRVLPWCRDWIVAPLSRIPPAPLVLAALVSGAVGSPLKKLDLNS